MPKKSKNCKYGTNPDGSCKPKPKSRVGTRTPKEIRHHKIRNRDPYLSDVSGVGIGITKKLEKRGLVSCNDLKSKAVRVEELTAVEGIGESIAHKIFTFCKLKITGKAKVTKTPEEIQAQELGNARYFILQRLKTHNLLYRTDKDWNRHPAYQKVLNKMLKEGIIIESEWDPDTLAFNDNKKYLEKGRAQVMSKLKLMNYVDYQDLYNDIQKDEEVYLYKGSLDDILSKLKTEGYITEEVNMDRRKAGGTGYFLYWRGKKGAGYKRVLTNRVKNASDLVTLTELEKEIIDRKSENLHYATPLLEQIKEKREKIKRKVSYDYFDSQIKGEKREVYNRFIKQFKIDDSTEKSMIRDFENVNMIYEPAHIVGLTTEERILPIFTGKDWVEVTPKRAVLHKKIKDDERVFGAYDGYYVSKIYKTFGGKTTKVKVYVNTKKVMPLKFVKDDMVIMIAPRYDEDSSPYKDTDWEDKESQAFKRIKTGIKQGFDYGSDKRNE